MIDDRGQFPSLCAVNITLLLRDTSSTTPGRETRTLDVDFTPADIRALCAQLLVVAEQVGALSRQAAVTR